LTKYLPPIGDQGQYGTCVAWATAYNCKTTLESIKYGFTAAQLASPQYQLSPRDLFLNIDDAKKGANDWTFGQEKTQPEIRIIKREKIQ
jgi:hypothetical protein